MKIMKLELKHLAPYQEHKIKLLYKGSICNIAYLSTKRIAFIRTDDIGEVIKMCWEKQYVNIKPIFRPLSDYKDINGKAMNELNCDIHDQIQINELAIGYTTVDSINYGTIKLMAKNHIDFHRLIEHNLAIDINTI